MHAEIGNATVGSLASCTSKDSSLKAPGTFGSLVATVTYVSHTGEVRPWLCVSFAVLQASMRSALVLAMCSSDVRNGTSSINIHAATNVTSKHFKTCESS